MFLDFDGSLSPIVSHPERARPAPGVREAVELLVDRYRVVAVVTGRRSEEVAALLGVEGVRYEGLYGMQVSGVAIDPAAAAAVAEAAAPVPEAWVEDKGVTLSVHYRGAPDPARARRLLVAGLEQVAARVGMVLVEGKMVLELVPPDRPMKGGAIERVARELDLAGALFAGDDVADVEAFLALDRLAEDGLVTLRVAVRGDETPEHLVRAADVVVEGPGGLVELLGQLV